MVDLHTHILPGIDDGASNFAQSIRIMEMELNDDVTTVALTPHFHTGQSSPEEFMGKREKQTKTLRTILSDCGFSVRLLQGAEVRLSPDILDLSSLKELCIEGTDTMLVELPAEYYYEWIPKALFELRISGIVPLLAHIERYPYFLKNYRILSNLILMGCMAQINADCLISGSRQYRQFAFEMIRRRLVQVMATDTHSAIDRPPKLKDAMNLVSKKLGKSASDYLCGNAEGIVESRRQPQLEQPQLAVAAAGATTAGAATALTI